MKNGVFRVELDDPIVGHLDSSLTDARFYDADQSARRGVGRAMAARLAQGGRPMVAVGLSRQFEVLGTPGPRHWLQVNNLHFPDYLDDHPVFRP